MSNQQIELTVGNRPYKVAVEPGQEQRLRSVAEHFDKIVHRVQTAGGSMERDRVMVMAGLMLADEFFTMRNERETEQHTLENFHNALAEKIETLLPEGFAQ